jgi:hypothetical protein
MTLRVWMKVERLMMNCTSCGAAFEKSWLVAVLLLGRLRCPACGHVAAPSVAASLGAGIVVIWMVVAALIAYGFNFMFVLLGGLIYLMWMAALAIRAARRPKADDPMKR